MAHAASIKELLLPLWLLLLLLLPFTCCCPSVISVVTLLKPFGRIAFAQRVEPPPNATMKRQPELSKNDSTAKFNQLSNRGAKGFDFEFAFGFRGRGPEQTENAGAVKQTLEGNFIRIRTVFEIQPKSLSEFLHRTVPIGAFREFLR